MNGIYYVASFFLGFIACMVVIAANLWGQSLEKNLEKEEGPPRESLVGKVEFIDAMTLEEKYKKANIVDDILTK